MAIGAYISKMTWNVNGLNAPNKWHGLGEWIQKQYPYICCLLETPFRARDIYKWKRGDGKRYSMQMEIKRKPDWQFSYQKKIDQKIKTIIRDKEGHYQMIKGSVQENT